MHEKAISCASYSAPGQTFSRKWCLVEVVQKIKEEDGSINWAVEVTVLQKTHEGTVPGKWEIFWWFDSPDQKRVIQNNFWPYIDKHCPEPEWVREAVKKLKLPSESEGLFEEAKV